MCQEMINNRVLQQPRIGNAAFVKYLRMDGNTL